MTDASLHADELTYRRYLESAAWRRTRSAALLRAGNRCAIDASHTEGLEVLHNSRERLGYELEHDLVVLCARCRQVLSAAAVAEAERAASHQNVVTLRRVATADGGHADVADEHVVTHEPVVQTWATVQALPVPPAPAPPAPPAPAPPSYRPWNPAGGSVAPPPPGGSSQPSGEDPGGRGPRRRRRLR